MSFFQRKAQLTQPHPDRVVADAKGLLEFLEGGIGMVTDVGVEFLRVEFAPVAPALLWSQRPGLLGVQITVNRASPQFKTPGGLGFGTPFLDEFDHPFPQVQCISFHALKPITLCTNVNMKCYNDLLAAGATPQAATDARPLCFGVLVSLSSLPAKNRNDVTSRI